MWKVPLLLACVAGSAIVFCDGSSNDDCTDTESSLVDASSSYSSSSLSSASSSSSQTALSTSSQESSDADVGGAGSAEVDGSVQSSSNSGSSDDSNSQDYNGSSKLTPTYQCGPNQVFSNCTNSGCEAQYCSQAGKPVPCVRLDPKFCKKGCVCAQGYLRTASGTCVLRLDCDEGCGEDPNAKIGCGFNCRKKCSDYKITNKFYCPRIQCIPNKCDCKDGWVLDENVKKCVRPEQCTPICGENEQYNSCTNGGCGHRNCSQLGTPQICIDRTLESCTKGCICRDGYLRGDNGTCVPQDQCPVVGCGGDPHAKSGCGVNCGKTCETYKAKRPICPRICIVGGCDCIEGYVFDSTVNKCVLPQDCKPVVTTTTDTPVTNEPILVAKPTFDSGNESGIAALKTGVTNFNNKFLYDRLKAEQGNLIMSPYSVFTPLAQLALYASGDSFKQLTTVLNVQTKEQIRSEFPALVTSFEGQTSVNFSTADKVYCYVKYPLSDAFIKDSADVAHAEAQDVDFSQNAAAAETINTWVESQTNNRIHDLISPSDLSSLTRLVLVNAIYFKGEWHYAFNKNQTIDDAEFYLSDGSTKKTKLMYQEGQFRYGEVPELNCTVLQMFYKGDNFSMVVVLPNEKDGLLSLAENLQEQTNFDKVMGSMYKQKVKVYLPPFTVTTTTDLADVLKQMGVTNIFDEQNSGLSGMLKTPEDIYVSKAIQKAFIEVNEEGSEAAAANGVIVSTRALPLPPPEPVVFRADRPFLFYIRLQNTTMFCGAKNDV